MARQSRFFRFGDICPEQKHSVSAGGEHRHSTQPGKQHPGDSPVSGRQTCLSQPSQQAFAGFGISSKFPLFENESKATLRSRFASLP